METHRGVFRHGRSIRGFDSLIKCEVEGQMEGLFCRFVAVIIDLMVGAAGLEPATSCV
jgi:hypothetical protein